MGRSTSIWLGIAGAAVVSLFFSLASDAGPGGCPDADSDGICDIDVDNCTGKVNPAQRDDDEDGYGNLCDEDVSQDCAIGGPDLSTTFARLGLGDPWSPKNAGAYDVNEDGAIGGPDLSQIFGRLGQSPGPSGRSCADCTATPTAGLGLGVCP